MTLTENQAKYAKIYKSPKYMSQKYRIHHKKYFTKIHHKNTKYMSQKYKSPKYKIQVTNIQGLPSVKVQKY